MSILLANPANDTSERENVLLHPAIVPDGYMLTTRLMRHDYVHASYGCPTGRHAHPEHVVFWPTRGTGSVEVDGSWHSVTVGQGVWVPAGTAHAVKRDPSSTVAAVHVLPSAWQEHASDVRAVTVRPALQEMLLYLMKAPMPKQQRLRAQQVCLDLIADERLPTLDLVMPQDDRVAPIAEMLLTNPADGRPLEEWAWDVSLSSRTIARAFRSSTGLTFNEWRTRARIMRAVDLLGEGVPVGAVARKVGYATIGAFSNAFYRVVGRRPQEFHPLRLSATSK